MKHSLWLLTFLLLCVSLSAYQNAFPSLNTPTQLYKSESEIYLAHRFYGAVNQDVWDTMFGINSGANVSLGYRYNLGHNLELKTAYTRADKQYQLGASWRATPADFPLQAQLDVQFFSFVPQGLAKRGKNCFYLLSAQSEPLFARLSLTLNAGFDGYYERLVNGAGLQVKLTDKLFVLGEYYPVWDRSSAKPVLAQYLGDYDAYTLALKADTYGHHFIFSLGNGSNFSPRSQALGTDNKKLRLGFNIQRRLGA